MKYLIFFNLLLYFLVLTAGAQEVAHFEVFDVENGLPSNEIYDVEESSDGYLWIATDRGVGKFDGENFEVFSSNDGLIDDCVLTIHEDAENRLWFVGLSQRQSYLNDGQFIDFKGNEIIVQQHRLHRNHQYVHHYKDTLYFGHINRGLRRVIPTLNLYAYNHAGEFLDSIPSWYLNESRRVEIFHVGDGAIIVSEFFFYFHEFHPTVNRESKDRQLSRIAEHFISIIEFIERTKKITWQDNSIRIHTIRRFNEQYYLATSSGLWSFSTPILPSTEITNILPDVNATNSFVDREGNIWVTSVNSGLIKISNEQFIKFNKLFTSNQDHPVSLRTYKDELLLCTEKSKFYTIGNNQSIKSALAGHLIRRFPENIKTLGTKFGQERKKSKKPLTFYALEKSINLTEDLIPVELAHQRAEFNRVFGFANQAKKIWIATINGLKQFSHFTKDNNKIYDLDSTFFEGHRISDVRAFNQGVLFSGLSHGLFFLKDNKCIALNHKELDNHVINCLKVEDDSTLWIGTNVGLILIHLDITGAHLSIKNIKKYSTKDGIISNFILDVEHFNNYLWVATPKGLMYFDPTEIEKTASAPPLLFLNEFHVNEHIVKLDSTGLPELKYNENNIEIQFSGVCNQRPIDFPFYHFELFKNGTMVTSSNQNESFLKFSDLVDGDYSLKLWAKNRAKIQSEPIELDWRIRPHWTSTPLFIGLMSLLILGIGFLIFRARSQKLIKERQLAFHLKDMELRSLRGQLNPHFVFNVLNSIQLYIYKNEQKEAVLFLKKFANLMRSFLEQSKLDFISLNKEYEFLEEYLSLEKIRIQEKLEFSITLADINTENKLLIPSLILQPLIENAIKHGVTRTNGTGTLEVVFSLSNHNNYINVDIINSGPPFQHLPPEKQSSATSVHGLSLVQERIDLLRTYFGYGLSSMKVTSPLNNEMKDGTKVTVSLPIKTRK